MRGCSSRMSAYFGPHAFPCQQKSVNEEFPPTPPPLFVSNSESETRARPKEHFVHAEIQRGKAWPEQATINVIQES